VRLDAILVSRNLVRSRDRARELVRGGFVEVDGVVVRKPAFRPHPTAALRVQDELGAYVGRAAGKLAGALDDLPGFQVDGKRVLDAGASTGGFTQVLLERGAVIVFAVDVGRGQLADRVARDPRVRSMPATDVRRLAVADLDGSVDAVVADLSFISLTLVLPTLAGLLGPRGDALLLVKPQFEAGRQALDSRGVVRDGQIRAQAVAEVAAAALAVGLRCLRVVPSQLPGSAGNAEFFLWLTVATDRGVGLTMSEVRDGVLMVDTKPDASTSKEDDHDGPDR
jgi:23S rRNA (cytidine1920-2'-O)/16S rRNA (cytidine1409-2'-O)-methyltransferase